MEISKWSNTQAIREVECPRCQSIENVPCVTPKGKPYRNVHVERSKKYIELIGKEEFGKRHSVSVVFDRPMLYVIDGHDFNLFHKFSKSQKENIDFVSREKVIDLAKAYIDKEPQDCATVASVTETILGVTFKNVAWLDSKGWYVVGPDGKTLRQSEEEVLR